MEGKVKDDCRRLATMEIEMPDDDDADDADAGELSPTDAELKDLSAACSRLWPGRSSSA